jgi:hypothetical protein
MSEWAAATKCGIELALGLAGIAGTLLGTGVGAFVTWKGQARQIEHEDRTRFHQQRLAVYAAFNDACNTMVAAIAVNLPYLDAQAAVIRTFETLRLVASSPVVDAAGRVHAAVTALSQGSSTDHPAVIGNFNSELAALCRAMRTEIGSAPGN